MDLSPETQFVIYNGLPMQCTQGNVLLNDDDGAIIDWLSQFNYPRAILSQDGTNTLVLNRAGELDLIVVNNYTENGGTGLSVGVWIDFVQHQNDLQFLGKPYAYDADPDHQERYRAIWNNIDKQVRQIAQRESLPAIEFRLMDGQQVKPHFRYTHPSS